MLRLLPNLLYSKSSEKKSFLQKLFLLVLGIHLFFFGFMILISITGTKQNKFTIMLHQSGATYVLMPFQKKVEQNNMNFKTTSSSIASKKSQVITYDAYLEHKKNNKNLDQKQPETQQASTKIQQNTTKSKKIKSKATTLLANKTHNLKKTKHKKIVPSKNKKQKQNKIQIVEHGTHEAGKNLNTLQETVQEQQMNQALPQVVQNEQSSELIAQKESETMLDNVIFVGYEQFDECIIGSKIQQAIVQNWTSPVGLDHGVTCEMRITVSQEGLADSIEIIKTSGVLVFDMSARSTLQQIEFPKEIHGKTIMITLCN